MKTGAEILNVPMDKNDAGATDIREYLKKLLKTLLEEREGFSGKRPFGNSGWHYDLYVPLLKTGFVNGKLDDDGCIIEIDEKQAFKAILSAVNALK